MCREKKLDEGKGLPQKDIPQEVRLPDGTIDRPITRKKVKDGVSHKHKCTGGL